SATFKIRGPPELNKLSSNINASFFRGDISGESYDQMHLSFQSLEGFLTTDRVQIIKGPSIASLSGTLSPKGEVKAYATAKNFYIDQSEFLKSLNLNVAGNLNMEAEFGGFFMKPEIKAKGSNVNMLVGDRSANNSNFDFKLNSKDIEGHATLMGENILVNYKWPFSHTDPYYLNVKANRWNFAQFFNITNDTPRAITHHTELTAEVSLEGPRPEANVTSGFVKIDKLIIRNGNSEIASEKPITLDIKNGMLADREFTVSGGSNYFKFTSNKSSLDHLDVKVDGRLDLLLVSILTPFLDDLRGNISINVGINGPITSPNLMGSLVVQDGFVRIKNFPHPFEQIKGDLLFSQKKLLINSVRGRLAGGIVSGGGQVEFISSDNIPIDIRGAFQDCVFNVPEGMSTRGSGEYYIHGNYVPYTLGGIYSIYSGSFEKKINASEEATREVRPSPYLPKFLVEKQTSPINLDLGTILQNPVSITLQMPQVVIKTAVDGRLVIKGPPASTLLTGRLSLSVPSTITVRDNVFNVTNGTVEYKSFPPENPELNVSAESRISLVLKDNIEREYDVYARFTGPAQKLNIQMSSQPQLSEQELISLVTLGFVNEADNATDVNNPSAQASSTGYQIGSQ
ncbi:MAG: translocation/assembly module TamB domain-containing protein, partial [Bdellovibrionota bacterium]